MGKARMWLVLFVVLAVAAGAIVGVAAGLGGSSGVTLHANFDSFVSSPTADCPSLKGVQVLVLGRGVATGGMPGGFKSAVGTAAECSSGQKAGTAIPTLANCHNIPAGQPFFDVHGKGFYMTKDGSVLRLIYHEISKNPFIEGKPPFELHDCGVWQVDGANSTGIFHGATGNGTITADVPVRADYSAHVQAIYAGDITTASGAKALTGLGQDVACNGTLGDFPITGPIHVTAGQVCDLEHSAVNGDVTVDQGGTLIMQNSIADGDVTCNGCTLPTVFYSTVNNITVSKAQTPKGTKLQGVVVKGNMDVNGSGPGPWLVQANFTATDLSFTDNTGKSVVRYNTSLLGGLHCSGNNPAPTGKLNTARGVSANCNS
jgi:hypothetical protein